MNDKTKHNKTIEFLENLGKNIYNVGVIKDILEPKKIETIKEIMISWTSSKHKTSALRALAGVAQWIKSWPMNQSVAGLIPSQDTCLGFGPGPQCGVDERQPHIDVSLPLFFPPLPSL